MKLKTLISFNDKEAGRVREVGEEFEVHDKRGEQLLSNEQGLVELAEEEEKDGAPFDESGTRGPASEVPNGEAGGDKSSEGPTAETVDGTKEASTAVTSASISQAEMEATGGHKSNDTSGTEGVKNEEGTEESRENTALKGSGDAEGTEENKSSEETATEGKTGEKPAPGSRDANLSEYITLYGKPAPSNISDETLLKKLEEKRIPDDFK